MAWSYDQFTRTQIAGTPAGGTAAPGTTENLFLVPRLGGAAGVGVELGLTPNWAARLEYLYTDYGSRSVTFPGGAQQFTSSLAVQSVRVGLDYQLGHTGIDPDIFTKGPSALDLDRFSFKGQTTFIEQYTPPFRSPYLGPHSLDPNQGRESWDAMYFVGAKLWQGAEFWVDPEIDPGLWAERHRRRCRISERRLRQGRRLGAVYAHSTRLHAPDHRSRRRDAEGRGRPKSVRRLEHDRPAGDFDRQVFGLRSCSIRTNTRRTRARIF